MMSEQRLYDKKIMPPGLPLNFGGRFLLFAAAYYNRLLDFRENR